MEVEPITPGQAAEKALAAWAAAIEAIQADTPPVSEVTPVSPTGAPGEVQVHEIVHGDASVPVSEPALPGIDSDHGHETATLQTLWRLPTHPAEPTRVPQTAIADVPAAQGDFALPDALLAPATLTGLRAEPAMAWTLPTPSTPWTPTPEPERRRQPREQPERRQPPREQADDDAGHLPPQNDRQPETPQTVIDADDADEWREALSRGLQAQLTQLVVPPALLAANEQWQRGRCVVLAFPQGSDPAGAAWAHVLWPHPNMRASGKLALHGLRVGARLQWLMLPPVMLWCHARLIREHHPRHGRQMVMADIGSVAPGAALPCAVQLGPVLESTPRRCEVRVHVPAAQRFWAALGRQWSVHAVVCARPLLAATPRFTEATPC
ncbi:MAG TPA: hypothetical protein VLJ62_22335 [Burkholderiaceae bacterium]|nr:hypothetical protein [Burkholderiaceae bacterium]